MTQGIRLELGNGTKARFWWDRWLECGILKDVYPRLFSLSNQKECCVKECGFWDRVTMDLEFPVKAKSLPIGVGGAGRNASSLS